MITKVAPKGARLRGLVEYLFGAGSRDEHVDARVVASWTPGWEGSRPDDMERALLSVEVEDPVMNLPAEQRPDKHVYHVAVSNHAEDRRLSDDEWRMVAHRLAATLGLTEDADTSGARWFAVHHGMSAAGNDHIHFVATLVREEGAAVELRNDFRVLREAAKELCAELGLDLRTREVGDGVDDLSRMETARQAATQEESPRELLRRVVRGAATAASDEADFVDLVRGAGVLIRPRWASGGRSAVTGYSVATRGAEREAGASVAVSAHGRRAPHRLDKTRPGGRVEVPAHQRGTGSVGSAAQSDGSLVWFSGGRLGRDLTLAALREQWDAAGNTAESLAAWEQADPWRRGRAGRGEVRDVAAGIGALADKLRDADLTPAQRELLWRECAAVLCASSLHLRDTEAGTPAAKAAHALAGGVRARSVRGARSGGPARHFTRVLMTAGLAGRSTQTAYLINQLSMLCEAVAGLREASQDANRALAAAAAARHMGEAATAVRLTQYEGLRETYQRAQQQHRTHVRGTRHQRGAEHDEGRGM